MSKKIQYGYDQTKTSYVSDSTKGKNNYKDNWNELKEWLGKEQINSLDIDEWTIMQVRDKMQEIESRK